MAPVIWPDDLRALVDLDIDNRRIFISRSRQPGPRGGCTADGVDFLAFYSYMKVLFAVPHMMAIPWAFKYVHGHPGVVLDNGWDYGNAISRALVNLSPLEALALEALDVDTPPPST